MAGGVAGSGMRKSDRCEALQGFQAILAAVDSGDLTVATEEESRIARRIEGVVSVLSGDLGVTPIEDQDGMDTDEEKP
jgi:hypothetical protein